MNAYRFSLLALVFFAFTLPGFAKDEPIATGDIEPYAYVNSKDATYYLRSTQTKSKDGKARTFYYFTKKAVSEKGTPVASVPKGYLVSETKNGLPVLKKDKKPADKSSAPTPAVKAEKK